MADKKRDKELSKRLQKNKVPRYYSGTPGVSGAIKDLVNAVGRNTGPGAAIDRRPAQIDQAVDDAQGLTIKRRRP